MFKVTNRVLFAAKSRTMESVKLKVLLHEGSNIPLVSSDSTLTYGFKIIAQNQSTISCRSNFVACNRPLTANQLPKTAEENDFSRTAYEMFGKQKELSFFSGKLASRKQFFSFNFSRVIAFLE